MSRTRAITKQFELSERIVLRNQSCSVDGLQEESNIRWENARTFNILLCLAMKVHSEESDEIRGCFVVLGFLKKLHTIQIKLIGKKPRRRRNNNQNFFLEKNTASCSRHII